MSFTVTSPVTGGAQTGFTTPTYTLLTDVAPTVNGKQYAVSAVSGTGNTPRLHSVSDPFTITLSRAAVLNSLPSPNAVTGKYAKVPRNVHKILLRKGVNYAANQAPEVFLARLELDIPAGGDSYNPIDVRAGLSLLIGALTQISAGIGDTAVTGVP
jgi:hypothetical protein